MVHAASQRREQSFLAVNCGALSPQLIESEIFGHERGSFTGADRRHLGFFEKAHGGTLFLDEVTEMPLALQVKLLRVLEGGSFMRVGSTAVQQVDVRIIAATNRDAAQAVASGALREDLFYRLNVFPIEVPPLRTRQGDIALLAQRFLRDIEQRERHAQRLPKRFTAMALQRLDSYSWPGNVRELRNAVQRAWVMACGQDIDAQWLPALPLHIQKPEKPEVLMQAPPASSTTPLPGETLAIKVGMLLADVEKQLILATFALYRGHKEATAAALGISMKTLYNRLKQYQVWIFFYNCSIRQNISAAYELG